MGEVEESFDVVVVVVFAVSKLWKYKSSSGGAFFSNDSPDEKFSVKGKNWNNYYAD